MIGLDHVFFIQSLMLTSQSLSLSTATQPEAAKIHGERNGLQNETHSVPASAASSAKRRRTGLPVLASACPGWICYAEKTHGEYALPYISTVKSPQVSPTMCYLSFELRLLPFFHPSAYWITLGEVITAASR